MKSYLPLNLQRNIVDCIYLPPYGVTVNQMVNISESDSWWQILLVNTGPGRSKDIGTLCPGARRRERRKLFSI